MHAAISYFPIVLKKQDEKSNRVNGFNHNNGNYKL